MGDLETSISYTGPLRERSGGKDVEISTSELVAGQGTLLYGLTGGLRRTEANIKVLALVIRSFQN